MKRFASLVVILIIGVVLAIAVAGMPEFGDQNAPANTYVVPRYKEKTFLPFKRDEVFDLVADVAKYPEFLPWCVGARILTRRGNQVDADLMIGFSMFREN